MDYTIDTLPGRLILGEQTETGVNDIRIDMSEWLKQWPELAISIWPTRPGEKAAYPADTYMDGGAIIWRVNNADTAIAGSGTVQIMGVADGQKKLSKIMTTYIANTTTGVTTGPPEAAKPWVDGVAASAASAQQAAQRAEDAAGEIKGISAVAQTLKPGQAATAEYADGVLVFGIPAGERGPQGKQGPKGDKGDTGPAGADAPQEAVLYTAQSLTDEQQAQARENIAAAGVARVEAVETALGGKLSEPAEGLAVGKYFRVAALDENGHAVLEAVDAAQVGVQDVQVNGASIVDESGKAMVPNCGVGKYGLLQGTWGEASGTTFANETLYIVPATNNQISGRIATEDYSSGGNNRHPIVPSHLDFAVKSAMCDGKGAVWTTEEQAAARERMGIYDWIMFADITLDESTTSFNISINSVSFNELLIYMEAQGTGATCKWKIGCTIGGTHTQALWNDSATTINEPYYAYLHLIKFGGKYISRACKPRPRDVYAVSEQVHILPYSVEYSDDNKVSSVSFSDWDFAAGSKIYVMYR